MKSQAVLDHLESLNFAEGVFLDVSLNSVICLLLVCLVSAAGSTALIQSFIEYYKENGSCNKKSSSHEICLYFCVTINC